MSETLTKIVFEWNDEGYCENPAVAIEAREGNVEFNIYIAERDGIWYGGHYFELKFKSAPAAKHNTEEQVLPNSIKENYSDKDKNQVIHHYAEDVLIKLIGISRLVTESELTKIMQLLENEVYRLEQLSNDTDTDEQHEQPAEDDEQPDDNGFAQRQIIEAEIPYTEAELAQIAKDISEKMRQHQDADIRKKAIDAEINADMKNLMKDIQELTGQVRQGFKTEEVTCRVEKDYDKQQWNYIDDDNNIVRTRAFEGTVEGFNQMTFDDLMNDISAKTLNGRALIQQQLGYSTCPICNANLELSQGRDIICSNITCTLEPLPLDVEPTEPDSEAKSESTENERALINEVVGGLTCPICEKPLKVIHDLLADMWYIVCAEECLFESIDVTERMQETVEKE